MERKPLTVERWRQIETIFHQAAAVEESVRGETLTRLCESDIALRVEVEAMLAASDREGLSAPRSTEPAADLAGRRVGNYRLERMLGEGGMGAVYLASRADGQFEQLAAVKLLAAYLRGEFFTDRFRVERQALANLNHPKVTRLLDSGVTPEGDPYLVMEYVDGQPIDEYCDQNRLSIHERIRLFLQVCEAVEYAHRNRIVHRDLKPGNIFVTREGAVKLLDFGTAKLLAIEEGDITRTRFRMMTPRYASPEQLRGESVTHQTDVYSLGIVLYELLTGAWPFGDPTSAVAGLERAIREVDPRPPGRTITQESAEARSTSAAKLSRTIDGDLANITLKAIPADARQRYGSVEELANDLKNYLDGKPVLARRQTLAYRAGKFVRRNRVATAVAGIAVLGLCATGASIEIKRRAAMRPPPSIAVLPVTTANADASAGPSNIDRASAEASLYLRSGMTDEIMDALARLKGLKVISRASTVQAAAQAAKPADANKSGASRIDARKIGRTLNVTHVLETSVERAGDQLTVVSSLIRTSDGAALWTDKYQRMTTDMSAIETDLEIRIIDSLGLTKPARKAHLAPDSAHDLYLKARVEANQESLEANAQAQQDFRRAIEIDPEYAEAYVGLAAAIWNRNAMAGRPPDWTEIKPNEQLLQKAIELDPGNSRAHFGLGLGAEQYDWDWNRAEREFQASLAAGPNAAAEIGLAIHCLIFGRRREADEHLRRGRDLDPVSIGGAANAAIALHLEGRFAEEREIYRQMEAQNPTAPALQIQLTAMDADLGKPNALENLRKLAEKYPLARLTLAGAEASAGHREEALRILAPMEANYEKGNIPNFQFARIHAALGDVAETAKWLNRSMEAREAGATYVGIEPVFAKMQNTPEFREMKKRMGLPQ